MKLLHDNTRVKLHHQEKVQKKYIVKLIVHSFSFRILSNVCLFVRIFTIFEEIKKEK